MIRDVHPDLVCFTHPGSRIQGSKRHRIPDPQQWPRGNLRKDLMLQFIFEIKQFII